MSAHLYLSACGPSCFLLHSRIEVPGLGQPPASEPHSLPKGGWAQGVRLRGGAVALPVLER